MRFAKLPSYIWLQKIQIVDFNDRDYIGQCNCTLEVVLVLPVCKCDQIKIAREFTSYGARSRMKCAPNLLFLGGASFRITTFLLIFRFTTLPALRGLLRWNK